VQILWWLQSGQATQVNELACLSGYHRTTVSGWLSQYRQGGLAQLLSRGQSSGRPCAITGDPREQLAQALITAKVPHHSSMPMLVLTLASRGYSQGILLQVIQDSLMENS